MNIVKSKIFWLVLTILLSAVGTGIWKYLLEPSLFFLTKAVLNLVTLGIVSLKNGIYIEISKGFHEGPSLNLLSLLLGISTGFFIGITGFAIVAKARLMKKAITGNKNISRIIYIVFLYFLFMGIVAFMFCVRTQYINKAVTHFHQLCAIVSPYVEDTEKEKYTSRFAQIQNRENYFNLISELTSIALNNEQTVPKFDIW